jgi:hypothetical protein
MATDHGSSSPNAQNTTACSSNASQKLENEEHLEKAAAAKAAGGNPLEWLMGEFIKVQVANTALLFKLKRLDAPILCIRPFVLLNYTMHF